MRVAIVFPGQGTHAPGMGLPWRDHPSWAVVERAEKALGDSLAHWILEADANELSRTREAQLAVLTTSLVAWDAVRERVGDPIAFAGHSLGQVSALIASGMITLDDGVRFAARRAELTQQAAEEHPGRMAALLGASLEEAQSAVDGETSWLANVNAPGQVVIAGTPSGVDAACDRAKAAGVKRARVLDVGGAFHTPLMDSAKPGLDRALADLDLTDPSAPVVSNADGIAYPSAAGWKQRLVEHPTVAVRWAECLRTLADLGAEALIEVGHGSMIAGVAKRTIPDVPVVGVAIPSDLETISETLS